MKIKAQNPQYPDGYEFTLTNLNAILPNNQEIDLDDEVVADYEKRTGKTLADIIKHSKLFGGTPAPKSEAEAEPKTKKSKAAVESEKTEGEVE